MDLFSSIPQWLWGIAAIAFCAWYVFGRGKKKSKKRTLSGLRRKDEAIRRALNIARNEEKLAEIERKKNKKRDGLLKW